jgi:hypothetical protein
MGGWVERVPEAKRVQQDVGGIFLDLFIGLSVGEFGQT